MSETNWPHTFTRDGDEVQIGEQKVGESSVFPVMAQPMVCTHCHITWLRNKEPQPQGPCPARSDKEEKKRLLNKSGS